MKEISRKCLIFPGSSPLIKSWKKLLLEVLNAYDDNDDYDDDDNDDDGDNDNDNDKSCHYTRIRTTLIMTSHCIGGVLVLFSF